MKYQFILSLLFAALVSFAASNANAGWCGTGSCDPCGASGCNVEYGTMYLPKLSFQPVAVPKLCLPQVTLPKLCLPSFPKFGCGSSCAPACGPSTDCFDGGMISSGCGFGTDAGFTSSEGFVGGDIADGGIVSGDAGCGCNGGGAVAEGEVASEGTAAPAEGEVVSEGTAAPAEGEVVHAEGEVSTENVIHAEGTIVNEGPAPSACVPAEGAIVNEGFGMPYTNGYANPCVGPFGHTGAGCYDACNTGCDMGCAPRCGLPRLCLPKVTLPRICLPTFRLPTFGGCCAPACNPCCY